MNFYLTLSKEPLGIVMSHLGKSNAVLISFPKCEIKDSKIYKCQLQEWHLEIKSTKVVQDV